MALTRSWVRNAPTTPLDARLMNMAGLAQNVDGSPRVGVLGAASLTLVTALATMHVAVAAAEFATSKGKADGAAIFTNDGTVNVAIAAAPASNSRIDVVWVKHNDDTTGDANALPVFGVTAGVAAPVPTKPAIPTGALELATLRVYSGTTAANGGANTLVNTFAMTASRGGVVPFRTKADLLLWTTAVDGQPAFVHADAVPYLNGAYERLGGAWVYRDYAAGTIGVTTGTLDADASLLVRGPGDMVELAFSLSHAAQSASFAGLLLPVGFRPITTISIVHQSYDSGFANRVNLGTISAAGVVALNSLAFASQTISRVGQSIKFKAAP